MCDFVFFGFSHLEDAPFELSENFFFCLEDDTLGNTV